MGTKLRGVNLGGWLVLERWMTPSLFAGTEARDEYSFMQTPGAVDKLIHHRETFITEADFKWLAKTGVNAVRIPVGYWVFRDDPPFRSAISYLDWAFTMAEKYHLKVLIDVHAAPGSQNGRDHSGKIGQKAWFRHKSYREQTIVVLEQLARRYRDAPALFGIELLNEPLTGVLQLKLRRFYHAAHARLRDILRAETVIVFPDAFRPRLLSGALGRVSRTNSVMMDIHWYHFGVPFRRSMPISWYFWLLRRRKRLLQRLSKQQPVIVGEWNVLVQHSTRTQPTDAERRKVEAAHAALQLEVYGEAAGWFYWNYKTEHDGSWNFRYLVENKRLVLQ